MIFNKASRAIACLLSALLVTAPAWAEKPEWAGKGKGNDKHEQKQGKSDKHDRQDKGGKQASKGKQQGHEEVKVGAYFNDGHRQVARTYYTQHYGGGKGCPPGLAKKNNGCMPPGQAKKWSVGQPLPVGVAYYAVPQPVLLQLPPVPVGYRYVRVASDILLIAVGSQMVVDGISDLLR